MKHAFTLEGLDCPNCAAKIEHDAAALPGVGSAAVNLMQQSLTLESDAEPDALLAAVAQVVHKHEPDVQVTRRAAGQTHKAAPHHAHEHGHCDGHEHDHGHCDGHAEAHGHGHDGGHEHEHSHSGGVPVRILVSIGLFAAGMLLPGEMLKTIAMLATWLVCGWDVLLSALKNIRRGRVFDENFLMGIATVGALAMGEFPEAAAVMLLYQIGEWFQASAVQKSRRSISALLDIRPDTANVLRDGETLSVPCGDVTPGETLIVRAGERIPLDGIVRAGESMLDTAALTGESVPRRVCPGDAALSGCINQSGTLTVEVTKAFGESTASKVIEMVENAAARKAPAEQFITKFARYYTPAVVIAAALLAVVPVLLGGVWQEWLRRACVFLIVSCPCALVISIPLTFFGGIGAASKRGVLVKGANYLDALSRVSVMLFDKTGTLTEGVFRVTELRPADGVTEAHLLELAAMCEQRSTHPIAQSILAAWGEKPLPGVTSCEERAGYGITAQTEGGTILTGSARLLAEQGVDFTAPALAGTKVFVAENGAYAGCILIADVPKADSKAAIAGLRKAGVTRLSMLTGDNAAIAAEIAGQLGLDGYEAELLPGQKLEKLEAALKTVPKNETLAFVGDGINDAPVLARADVGIAMGALGSDAAVEAADVVLMTDEPGKLVDAIETARYTKRIVMQNLVFALGVKALLLVLGALGKANMWAAVFGDVGVTVLAVLNAMRVLARANRGQR